MRLSGITTVALAMIHPCVIGLPPVITESLKYNYRMISLIMILIVYLFINFLDTRKFENNEDVEEIGYRFY